MTKSFAATPQQITVTPVAGYIGAEIDGIDLGAPQDHSTILAVRQALVEYKVLFFRDQRIGHREQIDFARNFGAVTPAHPHEDNPPEGFPEVLPID